MESFPVEEARFELRIIRVDWSSQKEVASIEAADHPIVPKPAPQEGHFTAEVPTYPTIDGFRHGQVAVSTSNGERPHFGKEDHRMGLEKIVDPTRGSEWWIEKGDWVEKAPPSRAAPGYHDAPSCRHAGTVLLHAAGQKCQIQFAPPGFDQDTFSKLLRDFQDDCWQLLLSNESYTTIPQQNTSAVPGDEFMVLMRRIVRAAEQILNNPHRELREVQTLKRPEQAHPVPRTFMELASKGWPKKVASRGHRSNFNTPENRYVASIIDRMLRAVHFLRRSGQARRDRLERRVRRMSDKVEHMEDGTTQVNPSRLEAFAAREEDHLRKWYKRAQRIFPAGPSPLKLKQKSKAEEIQLTFRVKDTDDGYNSITANVVGVQYEDPKSASKPETVYLQLRCGFSDLDFFSVGPTYKIELIGNVQQHDGFQVWKVYRVEEAMVVNGPKLREAAYLRSMADEIRAKDAQDQSVKLSHRWERQEQQRERSSLQQRISFYEEVSEQWKSRLEALSRLKDDLIHIKHQLEERQIQASLDARYPGTMVFVQRPAYREVHSAFTELEGRSGFGRDLFDQLISLDDLNILDLPTVYERWCLLQIVRVLEMEYGFKPVLETNGGLKPHPAWRQELVDTVCSTGQNAYVLLFRSERLRRQAKLMYQVQLPNRRRPDFLLEVSRISPSGSIDSDANRVVRAVLDAKFKQFGSSSYFTLGRELDQLINRKDYAQKGDGRSNPVFVLHPDWNSISEPSTYQEWADSSYYGGDDMFDWQEGFSNHQHGGVLLRPEQPDDIKRLIYMLMVYPIECSNETDKGKPEPTQAFFCPVCGGVNLLKENKTAGKEGLKYYLTCQNSHCGHFFVLNYCISCNNRLWKHGSYWTFHDTHAVSPYNVKCPSCGAYAATGKEASTDEMWLRGGRISA